MNNRVYISGVITSTTDYMKRFAVAEEHLTNSGYIVINPAKILTNMPEDTKYEEYMRLSMVLLEMCKRIYLLGGWEKSAGSNRELGFVIGKNMIIMRESEEK